ncbi:MAG: hypothetical protein Q9217_000387 [Psora testacea]
MPSSSENPEKAMSCKFVITRISRGIRRRPFDYSVKVKRNADTHVCPAAARNLFARDGKEDEYSCPESKPCKNGACCSKETGYCNYSPEACGTDDKSPNDKCWSNCDAHAECGRFAKEPDKKYPLNVCCSQFGFCGVTEEFCKKGKDKDEGCQSGCEQPDSGASGGDVQSRVIEYYKSWAHDSECRGIPFDKIPVEGLTHLYFSFGYISPNDFKNIPMDTQKESLFSDFTDLKKKNCALKTVVALGGWTFNDNGTEFQPVFSNMVSSANNRAKFISNLLIFLRENSFDGVDFDWEYPGAPDRSGHEKDGPNFTTFLEELKDAFNKDSRQPLRGFIHHPYQLLVFDLKAIEHVDFINVMSVQALAHVMMLDAGMQFQSRGIARILYKNSGTLSYKEITEIIDQKKLKPEYDKKNALKYMEIEFANKLGLGGLLIWATRKRIPLLGRQVGLEFEQARTTSADLNTIGPPQIATLQIAVGVAKLASFPLLINHAEARNQKVYCCEQTADEENKCYWTGVGDQCKKGDEPLTFAGTFLAAAAETAADLFPPSLVGAALNKLLDETKMDMMKRFCCRPDEMKKWKNCGWHGDPGSCNDNQCPLGHSVQLATNAYGHGEICWPRSERDDVDSDCTLETDNTWGDRKAETADKEPNGSSFGFVVPTSPEELQTSLDKQDGSQWELFNCNDAVSEDGQTIQMFCTIVSENSNCRKISSGGFVAGTILEVPPGCGPSKYAVAKSMAPAADQRLPEHLAKRDYGHQPTVYDLTFDFEWHRVRRDLGDTQMRFDFSDEVGYWDNIVAKAAKTKRKRSLEDFGGEHKRWLEEEWRDDFHNGALSHKELRKRCFGKGAIDLVKGLFNGGIKPEFTHDIDTTFTAILVKEQWGPCKVKGADVQANLLAQAKTNVKVSTSFGLTIITKLRTPSDLSQSYLYFKNKGKVSATFTLDTVGRAKFETGDKKLLGLQNFSGATFGIPKLLAVARTSSSLPSFDCSVTAKSEITAHLKPTFEFGIVFDRMWNVGDANVAVVADGWARLMAAAGLSSQGNCPFTYGIDLCADLYATVEAPEAFGWKPTRFPIAAVKPVAAKKGGTCPQIEKRSLGAADYVEDLLSLVEVSPRIGHQWEKRGEVFGPLIKLPPSCVFRPSAIDAEVECTDGIDESDELDDPETEKKISFCSGKMEVVSPKYDSSGDIVKKPTSNKTIGYKNPDDCDDYDFALVGIPTDTSKHATEHVLEFQLLKISLKAKSEKDGLKWKVAEGDSVDLCDYMKEYWAGVTSLNVDGKDNGFASEFVVLEKYVNGMKERMWSEQQSIQENERHYLCLEIPPAWDNEGHPQETKRPCRRRLGSLDGEVAKKDRKYTRIGLKDAWNSFMKALAGKARAVAEKFLDDWLKYMNDAWTDGDEGSGDENSDPNTGGNTNSRASRLAKLIKERDSMGTWSSPAQRGNGFLV